MAVQNSSSLIQINSLHKKYGNNTILHDVTFSIKKGHIVGVIGPNGAGKSTLANIILGFDSDYQGTVTIKDGTRIAYIPQFSNADTYVLPLSVDEFLKSTANTYYGLKHNITDEEIETELKHVGLDSKKRTQSVYSLSGGERQRVLIARGLLNNPDFMVLDEPVASVDYAARTELYDLLKHLNQEHKITILLISHDVDSIVAICDEVLCLNKTLHYGCHPASFVSGKDTKISMHHNCKN